MAEEYLDRLVRASLERRAGEVETTAPVAERARGAVRRRRATRVAGGAAAAVLVAAAVTGALVSGGGDGTTESPADRAMDNLPTEWRAEYWRDLKVEVPADWGYGGAPMDSGGLVSCYPEAMIGPDGTPLESEPTRGYVGRPIGLTDVCVTYPDNRPEGPQAPYVWLGAEIPTGTVDLGGGFVQETVKVNGTTLTVASDNAALRSFILDSAGQGETCPSELEQPPRQADVVADPSARVACAYSYSGGAWRLSYVAELTAREVEKFTAAFDAAPEPQHGNLECDNGSGDQGFVVLMVEGEAYVALFDDMGCPAVVTAERRVDLTISLMESWSHNGIRAALSYFIGPLG